MMNVLMVIYTIVGIVAIIGGLFLLPFLLAGILAHIIIPGDNK
ncbi:hypothetical protein UFOVP1437_25 [uncultured Caudovirales phage]|uniref:Uncharacterized protein n=1 Tax=uncultured Caudovirales phage TaxID=2100421 RepID=A0A6J5SE68_9CAUD|nr:hypothetical protein UFOVP1437_25 [uncultured Caudovirales phage]CAB5228145.1 hypothetical protein UFOVP1531_39 [uncultured Caudovirales phage]